MAKYPIHKTTNVTGSYYKTRHADSIVENIDKLVDKLKAKDGWENVDENDIIRLTEEDGCSLRDLIDRKTGKSIFKDYIDYL